MSFETTRFYRSVDGVDETPVVFDRETGNVAPFSFHISAASAARRLNEGLSTVNYLWTNPLSKTHPVLNGDIPD